MRWLRIPLLHFLVGGAVLFGLVHATTSAPARGRAEPMAPVTITEIDVVHLRDAYARETGLEPTPADEAALIDKAIDEELLFREAVARGLDRNDRSVRNWLIEQMRGLSENHDGNDDDLYAQARALELDRKDLVVRRILVQKMRLLASRAGEGEASDAELGAFYARHQADYRSPERVSFWHVFLRSRPDRPGVQRDAEELLAGLRRQPRDPADVAARGDPFPLPPHFMSQSRAQLAKLFGASFAGEVLGLEPRAWAGPLVSPHGLHLVWVEARESSEVPPLASVRGRVLERWREERRAERVMALLAELKARYPLHVDSRAWRERRDA